MKKFELKVKKSNLILYFILLSIIFENKLFYLVKVDNIIFKIITIIFIFFAFFITANKKEFNKKIYMYIGLVIIFIFIFQFLYSIFFLKYPIYEFLAESFRFLFIFAIPSFIYIFKNRQLNIRFWKNMKIISFIQYLINIIAIIILQTKGINITTKNFSYRSFGNVNVSIFGDSIFLPIIMIFSFYQILKEKEKTKWSDIFIIVFGLSNFSLIAKSRTITISFLLSAFIMFIFSEGRKFLKITVMIITVIYGYYYCFKYNLLNNIFSLKEGSFASSNQGHLIAIQECWNYFLKHPLLGAGLNLDWPVSYCDAGLMGLLANVGIIGAIIIYIFPLLKFTLIAIKQKFLFKKKYPILYFGYLSFLYLTSITLIMTDDVRMYGFVFILSIFYVLTN